MKKRILAYLAYIDGLLEQEDADWEKESKKHLVQIAFSPTKGRCILLSWRFLQLPQSYVFYILILREA